jgi:hypothetical protein
MNTQEAMGLTTVKTTRTSSLDREQPVRGRADDRTALARGWQRFVRAARREVLRLQLGPVDDRPWT